MPPQSLSAPLNRPQNKNMNTIKSEFNRSFDSVVMLTWSNWHTEPRSNRYHYATRFAKLAPVYFFQFDRSVDGFEIENLDVDNIIICHAPWWFAPYNSTGPIPENLRNEFGRLLDTLNIVRPLVWVYNPHSVSIAKSITSKSLVYHATENYLLNKSDYKIDTGDELHQQILIGHTKELAEAADLVVTVSDGVTRSISKHCKTKREPLELRNGCDAKFWLDTNASTHVLPENGRKRVLYQGGINDRLDFEIIKETVLSLPDFDFFFCGPEDESIELWQDIKALDNVQYVGKLDSKGIAEIAKYSDIGWIPFVDAEILRSSLPLKAYEYIACGLGVVTTMIYGLKGLDPDILKFATTSAEFKENIEVLAESRTGVHSLEKRKKIALENDYDARFETLLSNLLSNKQTEETKTILVLYDDRYNHIKTIQEHLSSFKKYSKNKIFYLPATSGDGWHLGSKYYVGTDTCEDLEVNRESIWRLDFFDAIIIHYSVRISLDGYFAPTLVQKVKNSPAKKILFIQDEYEGTNNARRYIEDLGISSIFTCVPEKDWQTVYPHPGLTFKRTLTGYVPEERNMEQYGLPTSQRKTLIGYRGRKLPHHYGILGWEKYYIGERVKSEAVERGLDVNISNDPSDRIYGSWYEFMGSCRATLGTESGANIFDFEGNLKKLADRLADKPFNKVYDKYFKAHDNAIKMNQISPKFFEAIRLRTALICFPGYYSDILHPHKHYIPLERDFSNINEVFEKIQDDNYIKNLTDRAYEEIIGGGKYSYASFISDFDDWIDEHLPESQYEVITTPIAVRTNGKILPIRHMDSRDYLINNTILGTNYRREEFISLLDDRVDDAVEEPLITEVVESAAEPETETSSTDNEETRSGLFQRSKQKLRRIYYDQVAADINGSPSLIFSTCKWLWRIIPQPIRYRIAAILRAE